MRIKFLVVLCGLVLLEVHGQAHATLTTYTNLASFQAVAGATQTTDFNSSATQLLATPATGVFSQPFGNITLSGNSNGDYIAIAAGTNPGNIDGTNFFYFSQRNPDTGNYDGDGGTGPTFTFNFVTPSTAFGFNWTDTDPTDAYNFTLNGSVFTTPPFNLNGTGSGFFGVVATNGETFTTVTFVQNAAGGIVDPFGIDNIQFSTQPALVTAVPEPTTIASLSIAGLFGLGMHAIRRRRRHAA